MRLDGISLPATPAAGTCLHPDRSIGMMIDESPAGSQPHHWPIRRLRVSQGLSLNELAAAVQMDSAHLELIERQSSGASPTHEELARIAAVLKCSVEDLEQASN
jgi:DNA-binding Xre family transcriptional regulator